MAQAHPVAAYTAARIGLFVAVLIPLALVGMRGLLLLAAAALISGMLSLVLLDGIRNQVGGAVAGVFQRLNKRIDDAARAEDDDQVGAQPDAS